MISQYLISKFRLRHNSSSHRQNNHGFINLTFVTFLSLSLVLFFTVSLGTALIEAKDHTRSQCLERSVQIQNLTLNIEKQLFNLNPFSTFIRGSIVTLKVGIVVATAALQFAVVAELAELLDIAYKCQNFLDRAQKLLIKAAETTLSVFSKALGPGLMIVENTRMSSWSKFLLYAARIQQQQKPQLAVQPDSIGGVGPNYEWKPEAESLQALAYKWNIYFITQASAQRFVDWFSKYSFVCGAKPDLKGSRWKTKIILDNL